MVLLFVSCKKENAGDCFKSNGKEIARLYYPGSFSEVHINSTFETIITQGADYKVELQGGANVLKNIAVVVKEGQLHIDNNNQCNFVRGYKRKLKLNITVPHIRRVVNNAVGPVYFDSGYQQDTITVRTESSGDIHLDGTYKVVYASGHGNGDLYLNGQCSRMYAYINGTNYLYAEGLRTSNYLFVETLSIGDCYLNLEGTNLFEYNIWRKGNIFYIGRPDVMVDHSQPGASGRAQTR